MGKKLTVYKQLLDLFCCLAGCPYINNIEDSHLTPLTFIAIEAGWGTYR